MSSILKALKKIEGRKVDKSLPTWSFGSGSRGSVDRHIHRSRQRQKILVLLIILCGAALATKLYMGFRPNSHNTVLQNTASPTSAPAREPAEEKRSGAKITVENKPRSTPAAEPAPSEASSETTPSQITGHSPVASPTAFTTPEPLETVIEEFFGTPPTSSADLSLMALAWSTDPESRFAVINGTIVQEGDNIEGTTIVRIEEEYIVMRTQGVTWKLK